MKDIYQSINLHGNIIRDGGAQWPTEGKHIASKEYVDHVLADVTGQEYFKEGTIEVKSIHLYGPSPYVDRLPRNKEIEIFVIVKTNFNDRPSTTTPTAKLIIDNAESSFVDLTADSDSYGFHLSENETLLYISVKRPIFDTNFIDDSSQIEVSQIFSETTIGEETHEETTVVLETTLSAVMFYFAPVISQRFDEPFEEFPITEPVDTIYIEDLGISTNIDENINVKSLELRGTSGLLPQNYYIVIPENDFQPNNSPDIGFCYWFKDNTTNQIISNKEFIDISNAETIEWCGVECNVVFLELGYIDAPNDSISLVVDTVFI